MPRTVQELEAAARALPAGHKLTVSMDEAKALVKAKQAAAVAHGQPQPDAQYLMKKAASGKASVFGRIVEVE